MLLWGRSVLGRQKVPQKVPPRFHHGCTEVSPRFHQGRARFVVSLVLWGRSVSGRQKVPQKIRVGPPKGSAQHPCWAAKRFRRRSVLGRQKVPQKVPPTGLLGRAKRFCGRFPHHFFKRASQFLNSLAFFPTALAWGLQP